MPHLIDLKRQYSHIEWNLYLNSNFMEPEEFNVYLKIQSSK